MFTKVFFGLCVNIKINTMFIHASLTMILVRDPLFAWNKEVELHTRKKEEESPRFKASASCVIDLKNRVKNPVESSTGFPARLLHLQRETDPREVNGYI